MLSYDFLFHILFLFSDVTVISMSFVLLFFCYFTSENVQCKGRAIKARLGDFEETSESELDL